MPPSRYVLRRDGSRFEPPHDYVLRDGERFVSPLTLKDASALSSGPLFSDPPSSSSIDEVFRYLPSEYRSKRAMFEGQLDADDNFVVETAIRNLEALSRQAALISTGNSTPWGFEPAATRQAAKRASDFLAGLAAAGRDRARRLRGDPSPPPPPANREQAYERMKADISNAWRGGSR